MNRVKQKPIILDGFLTIYFIEVYNGDCAASDFSVYIYKELMPEMTAIKKEEIQKNYQLTNILFYL